MGQLAVLLTILAAVASFTDLPEQMKEVYDQSILAGQQIATAGDLRSMSNMLDAYYFKRGRYPAGKHFDKWLSATFKESHLKELTVDHWGNRYVYEVGNKQKKYLLRSAGADGVIGTEDDMTMSGP